MSDLNSVNTIGLIGDVLGVVRFFKNLVPMSPEMGGAVVTISAGLDTPTSSNLGGEISALYGFDNHNQYLGKSGGVTVANGESQQVAISQKVGRVQCDFLSVASGKDAICIAWVAVQQRDGAFWGAWTGDVGAACGQRWYYSEQIAGQIIVKDEQGNDKKYGYKPRVARYGVSVKDTVNSKDDVCKFTTFDKDMGPIKRAPGGQGALPAVKRAVGDFPSVGAHSLSSRTTNSPLPSFDGQLITSNFTSHTSKQLCESETSAGPDFVGSDGMFCDMTTKTLTPLCSTQNIDGCIDLNTNDKTIIKRSVIARRSVSIVHKTYKNIAAW